MLTSTQRLKYYNKSVSALQNIKLCNATKVTLWDSDDPAIKRYKVCLNLFRDTGHESSATDQLTHESTYGLKGRWLIYGFSKQSIDKCGTMISTNASGQDTVATKK
jgi:hypothetical protein